MRVKENVKIPVIGNGDIDSPQKAKQRMLESGVDGVMIGRAVLGNPWLLQQTHEYLCKGVIAEPDIDQIQKTLLKHLRLLMEYYGEKAGIAVSRKHIGWYVRSLYEAKKFREQYTKLTDFNTAEQLINEYFSGLKK